MEAGLAGVLGALVARINQPDEFMKKRLRENQKRAVEAGNALRERVAEELFSNRVPK